jgi:hypothetical protein
VGIRPHRGFMLHLRDPDRCVGQVQNKRDSWSGEMSQTARDWGVEWPSLDGGWVWSP